MKLVYPAVFYPEDEGSYSVIIPDLNDLATQGESLADAIYMAEDACGLYIYTTIKDGEEVPKASDIDEIILDEEGAFVNLICIDMTEFAKKHNEKAVKKTLTIPAWLNSRTVEMGINFSAVLQEALQERLVRG
ncbi:MAG: type II toxin-antitoxin system HicB family antitoxin [Eubacterium sp.]|nr:type II toxin-antitoxin system HicB family antitoxin [Eubacterium sp.]